MKFSNVVILPFLYTVPFGILTFLFLRGEDRYDQIHVLFVLLISYLLAYMGVISAIAIFFSWNSLRLQFKVFGWKLFSQIPRNWRIKYRTPYIYLSGHLNIKRNRYSLVALSYLLVGTFLVYSGISSKHWYSDLMLVLGIELLCLIPMQFFVHGGSPIVTILGSSAGETLRFQEKIAVLVGFFNCRSLLDPGADSDAGSILKMTGGILRTREDLFEEWRESFYELAEITKIIVIDKRIYSEIVEEEINHIISCNLENKCMIIVEENSESSSEAARLEDAGFRVVTTENNVLTQVASILDLDNSLQRVKNLYPL